MMSKQTDTIKKYLSDYGLEDEEALIYLYMVENGASTALDMSRELHIGRTKVYRILDTLYDKGLSDQVIGPRGYLFEANPADSLEGMIHKKEAEINELRSVLPTLKEHLESLSRSKSTVAEPKVLYYEGVRGLEQVTWNSTKAKGKLLIYEIGTMNDFTEENYAEKVREQLIVNNVKTEQLTNMKSFGSYTKNHDFVKNYWKSRYVDPKSLTIEVETMVYNDVVSFYHTKNAEPFCVEIYNEKLASMQRQIFNFVWNKAKRMKVVKPGGASTVK